MFQFSPGLLEVLGAEKNHLGSEDVGVVVGRVRDKSLMGACQARMGWIEGMSCAPRSRMEEVRLW